jgi:predicted house-cleaning noncanonical NTP pyrophosphatase (MazG superfamily)
MPITKSKKYFRKLVRDNTPKNIQESGRKPTFDYLRPEDRKEALRNKLSEEVDELMAARNPEEILEEAADVLEVILAMICEEGYIDADLELKAKQKRRHCGSFDKFVWLESVEDA